MNAILEDTQRVWDQTQVGGLLVWDPVHHLLPWGCISGEKGQSGFHTPKLSAQSNQSLNLYKLEPIPYLYYFLPVTSCSWGSLHMALNKGPRAPPAASTWKAGLAGLSGLGKCGAELLSTKEEQTCWSVNNTTDASYWKPKHIFSWTMKTRVKFWVVCCFVLVLSLLEGLAQWSTVSLPTLFSSQAEVWLKAIICQSDGSSEKKEVMFCMCALVYSCANVYNAYVQNTYMHACELVFIRVNVCACTQALIHTSML
jgi:hypothetical protein